MTLKYTQIAALVSYKQVSYKNKMCGNDDSMFCNAIFISVYYYMNNWYNITNDSYFSYIIALRNI